jgi:hypothetical protein
MALGTTNISTAVVNTELGSPYTTPRLVSDLCTHANVQKWSRYKPGYFYPEATSDKFIWYQVPRGSGYIDPRGTNSDDGGNKESYRLGDFRGYNHTASAAYVTFPSATIEFASGTGTSFGISRTFYAEEIDWENDGVYRESHNWAGPITHVHMLDALDDSIQGTATLPAISGNVSIPLDGVSLTPGVLVTKTYHLAFGVDSTHWNLKLGTNYGAGGIGDVKMLELNARQIYPAAFDDSSFGGGANDPYNAVDIQGTNTNRFNGATQAIWDYATTSAWRCYYTGSDYDDYGNITADWYIKGFKGQLTTEYLAASAMAFASNGANNTVTLPVSGSPSTFSDGDEISLILRNLTINY